MCVDHTMGITTIPKNGMLGVTELSYYFWYDIHTSFFTVLITPLHRYTVTRLHHYTVTPLHCYTVTRYTVTPLHGYTFTRLHRYTVTRLHRYTVTPLHGYTVTRLHGYTVTPRVHRPAEGGERACNSRTASTEGEMLAVTKFRTEI